jgi:hypothetical protein
MIGAMIMNGIDENSIDHLSRPGPRLPALIQWLTAEVWTIDRFKGSEELPSRYLASGEELVNEKEILLTAAADSYSRELTAAPDPVRTIQDFFSEYKDGCVVILDGCSLREVPRLKELANISCRPVVQSDCGRSAIPSDTEHFILKTAVEMNNFSCNML